MLHATMTAGNLLPGTTIKFHSTLRPPSLSPGQLRWHSSVSLGQLDALIASKKEANMRHQVILPPAAAPTIVPSPSSRLVAQAIILAQGLDLTADHPYMPYEGGTSLREAHTFLQLHDYILIQGGRIDYLGAQIYYLTLRSSAAGQQVDYADVVELLSLNYPETT